MATQLHVVGDRNVVNGAVTVVPQREISEEEITKAEDELREEIKQYVQRIESTYWDLARGLYDVYDGLPGGYRSLLRGQGSRIERKEMFKKWGYDNFGDYCEKEAGIRKRTGENLRYAYFWFAIEQNLPEETIRSLCTIGRSKMYQLAGFATADNITLWIDKAHESTHEELRAAIKKHRIAIAEKTDTDEPDQSAKIGGGEEEDENLPKPEQFHKFATSLADSQWEVWQAALEQAKKTSQSDKIGHNLTMICQDYLNNNDFCGDSRKNREAAIKKQEHLLNCILIALDNDGTRPFYNAEIMWKVAEGMRDAERDDGLQ